MLRPVALALVLLAVAIVASAQDDASPLTWPVAFSEIYVLRPHEGTQLPLEPDGIAVRRFHLRVESEREIEIKVTRAHDSSILWFERRVSDADAVIPWGRGERGDISLFNQTFATVRVLVEIALDPAEDGRAVPSFYVSRFLEAIESDERSGALELLDLALEQDAQDSVASSLLARVTGLRGTHREIVEGRAVQLAREQIERARQRDDRRMVDALIEDEMEFDTELGHRRWYLLVGDVHLRRDEPVRAMQSFYAALDHASDVPARFEVYPRLVAANLAAGNTEQAEAIVERALREAPDDETRRQVESWRAQRD